MDKNTPSGATPHGDSASQAASTMIRLVLGTQPAEPHLHGPEHHRQPASGALSTAIGETTTAPVNSSPSASSTIGLVALGEARDHPLYLWRCGIARSSLAPRERLNDSTGALAADTANLFLSSATHSPDALRLWRHPPALVAAFMKTLSPAGLSKHILDGITNLVGLDANGGRRRGGHDCPIGGIIVPSSAGLAGLLSPSRLSWRKQVAMCGRTHGAPWCPHQLTPHRKICRYRLQLATSRTTVPSCFPPSAFP